MVAAVDDLFAKFAAHIGEDGLSFTTGPGYTTLPMLIWSKVKLGVTPDINALASVIVLIVTIGVAISAVVLTRADRRREHDIQMASAANN